MAFVNRQERDLTTKLNDVPNNIGPGTYLGHNEYKKRQLAAPFNSQVQRSRPLKKDNAPGPGSYNTIQHQDGQKVVLQSGQSEVKILEIPKPQSVFQSRSKRFPEQKAIETPGPGAYDTPLTINADLQRKAVQQQYGNNSSLMEQLRELNRYKSIPSIPTANQVHGYTEKGNNDLELNRNPQDGFSGLKQDAVGPGQYQLKDAFDPNRKNGPTWHKSKVARLAPAVSKDRELIVGPGAYDHDTDLIPLYKLNPTSGFLSKSQRIFDQQRGQKARDFMKVQFEQQKKKLLQNPSFADIQDEEIEFIEDATPGPGHYFQYSTMSTASTYSQPMAKLGQHVFGSKQKRFQEGPVTNPVGPGDYEISGTIIKQSMPYKQPPFLSSNTRFETKVLEKKPGPQSYNPKTTLEDKLIKKLERGPLGKFLSNEPRFQGPENEVPGPGYYDQNLDNQAQAANCVFKSQTRRAQMGEIKDIYPSPGAYDVRNFTIEQANRVEKEDDPDLAVKKPGFGSSLPRFVQPKHKIEEEDDEEPAQMVHNQSEVFRKEKKEHPAFNSQQQRFIYDIKNPNPGPGEYHDPKANEWDKKTYNILFSEI